MKNAFGKLEGDLAGFLRLNRCFLEKFLKEIDSFGAFSLHFVPLKSFIFLFLSILILSTGERN